MVTPAPIYILVSDPTKNTDGPHSASANKTPSFARDHCPPRSPYSEWCATHLPNGPVDDSALQLYKDGDYGAYLDLEASINEQQEEFDNFNMNYKKLMRSEITNRDIRRGFRYDVPLLPPLTFLENSMLQKLDLEWE
ncbi:unnamed protein product [Nezara viridula]|uniref:FHOD1 N-terminal GTPase-binding domain-containing protein n=1 Tax=Nezara viridula TaxID=85310 RepID=A0A9P0H2W0_NEZVI|nr:unnamed protein product [Nezara viridula]